jgi:NitT/TauT family transport system permease protein
VQTLRKNKKENKDINEIKDLKGLFFCTKGKTVAFSKGKKLKSVILPIMFFVLFIITWEFLIVHFDIPKRIIPKPTNLLNFIQKEFFSQKVAFSQTILLKALFSFRDALVAFVIALFIGTGIGILLSFNKVIYTVLSPFLFLFQIIPTPALAPVLAAILGYGQTTKMVLIIVFLLFPIAITIRNSLLNIPEDYVLLFKTYTKKHTDTFRYLKLPSLVPPTLSIMKVVAPASIVATITTELPLSLRNGIGKDIYNSFNNMLIPRVWVSVLLISLISLLFFKGVSSLEKYINNKYKYGQY